MSILEIDIAINEIIPSVKDNVVAVELSSNGMAEIFLRNKGSVTSEKIKFSPFLLLSEAEYLKEFKEGHEIVSLKGKNKFKYLVKFKDVPSYKLAIVFLNRTLKTTPGVTNAPYRVFSDIQQQVLIDSKIRLFREMTFYDLKRMQFDIETLTTEGYEFPNAARPDDKIIAISMCDSTGWEKCLLLDDKMTEEKLLYEFVATINERDPDVLEGHNIFRFDLPFIEERAKRHKVKLSIGRNSSVMTSRDSRFMAAEKTLAYKKYEVYGRHIIDTYFLAQLYDISHRDLTSYGLKSLAIHFNVATKGRTYIDAKNIKYYFNTKKEDLIKYALDDVRETRAISEILSPSYFYQTQLQPFSYQNIVLRGNATKIDAMLVSSYLTGNESIPVPAQSKEFTGALTDALESGIFENVWHCDIRSLYPSIIISKNISPAGDSLKKFYTFLKKLRDIRLKAKGCEKQTKNQQEKSYFNSLQTTFKIMINSFYGYLAFNQGTFNDYDAAEYVTSRGRAILTLMLKHLESINAKIIEMDTDGIYFQPPQGATSTEYLEKEIQKVLPEGIEVELDATYQKMFCYKSKNYALITENGELLITGAALKSRGVEPFIRDYIKELLLLLLKNNGNGILELTEKYKKEILERTIPLSKFAKTETLNDLPSTYKSKIAKGTTRRSAVYELALASGKIYSQGDQLSYYVTGTKKNVSVVDNCKLFNPEVEIRDENSSYYIKKIEELHAKFIPYSDERTEPDLFDLGLSLDPEAKQSRGGDSDG